MKDYLKSIADYNQILVLNPNDGNAYFYRGVSKYKLNDKVSACEDWNNALINSFPKAAEYINKICARDVKTEK